LPIFSFGISFPISGDASGSFASFLEDRFRSILARKNWPLDNRFSQMRQLQNFPAQKNR